MSILPYFYDIDAPLRMMERDIFRPGFFPSPSTLAPRGFFDSSNHYPWANALDILRPLEQLTKQMNQLAVNDLSITADDDEKFQVSVDVQHFAPEEISVKVVEGQVIVEGNHEEKQDGHGYVSRRFVRRYALPKGCLADTVQSKLSSDGVLTVTAPKVLPLPSSGERIIPIIQTGPIQKRPSSQEEQLVKMETAAEGNN